MHALYENRDRVGELMGKEDEEDERDGLRGLRCTTVGWRSIR